MRLGLVFYTARPAISLYQLIPTRSTREDSEGLLVKPYGLGSSTPSGGAGVLKMNKIRQARNNQKKTQFPYVFCLAQQLFMGWGLIVRIQHRLFLS